MDNGLIIFEPQPLGGGAGGGGNTAYNPGRPTTVTVGGLTSGTTPSGSIQDTLDKILYPFQAPAFTGFAISGQGTTLELGQSIAAGNKTFTWSTSNSGNVSANSITISDYTGEEDLATGLANDGSETVSNFPYLTKTDILAHVFRILGANTQSRAFHADLTLNWKPARFYGTIPEGSLTALQNIESSSNLNSVSGIAKTAEVVYSKATNAAPFNCAGGKYVFFLFDATLGAPAFTLGGFSVPFDLISVLYTNQYGIERSYNLYISHNSFNSSSVPIITT